MYLSTAQLPPLVLELSANNVTAGEQLIANCTASVPIANRELYIDGEPYTRRISADRVSSNSEGATTTRTIDPVLPGDAGAYSCVAGSQNTFNSDSPTQTVTVNCELQVCSDVACTESYFIVIFVRSATVSPTGIAMPPADNILLGQTATVIISVSAFPEITDVHVFLPNASAQEPSFSAVGVTSGNVTLQFSSVNRYNNGMYTVNFTNAIGTGTAEFQLTVYC